MRSTARSVRSSCRDCSLRSMATLIFFSVAHFSAFFSRSLFPGFNFCYALTGIPADSSLPALVTACLSEAPKTGECAMWASGNDYGTIPYWNVSLVTDMKRAFYEAEEFNGDISK